MQITIELFLIRLNSLNKKLFNVHGLFKNLWIRIIWKVNVGQPTQYNENSLKNNLILIHFVLVPRFWLNQKLSTKLVDQRKMSKIQVRFLIFALCGNSIYSYSSSALLKCPSPMRPSSVLSTISPIYNSTTAVRFDMCKCGGNSEDFVFRLVSISVKRGADPFIEAFQPFKDYCPATVNKCSVLLLYSPNLTKFLEIFEAWIEPTKKRQIVFHCDHFMSNCKSIWWPCQQWSQARNEAKLSWLIMEMMSPAGEVAQRATPAIKDEEKIICFVVILIMVVYLLLITSLFR